MINGLKSMLSQVFYAPVSNQSISVGAQSSNPFENPFVSQAGGSYAVNRPVKGGYFAGYYNGQPNIVGQRLFIEA